MDYVSPEHDRSSLFDGLTPIVIRNKNITLSAVVKKEKKTNLIRELCYIKQKKMYWSRTIIVVFSRAFGYDQCVIE